MEENQELIVPRGVSNFIQVNAKRKEKIANFSKILIYWSEQESTEIGATSGSELKVKRENE